jgi:hypothetical protein
VAQPQDAARKNLRLIKWFGKYAVAAGVTHGVVSAPSNSISAFCILGSAPEALVVARAFKALSDDGGLAFADPIS